MHLPLTPVRFLHRAIDLYGQKEGVVAGEYRLTYAEFGHRCLQVANGLMRNGLRAGDLVSVLSFNSHHLLESYYSIPACRAVFCPLNPRLKERELAYILRVSGSRFLIFEASLLNDLGGIRQACPSLRHFISIGASSDADCTYEEMLRPGTSVVPDWTCIDEDSTAEVFYTSGTAGMPKGVALSHRSLYLHALTTAAFYNQRDFGVELMPVPLFHANGWGRPHTATMNGLKQVLMMRFVPSELFRLIEEEQVTNLCLVPTMALDLLHAEQSPYDLSSLRQITIGGAISTPSLIERMEARFNCCVVSGYGLTESGPVIASSFQKSTITYSDPQERWRRQSMAGWPLIGTEMRVADEQLKPVPHDGSTVGQVVLRSDSVMSGYLGAPDETAGVLQDGWLLTGDLGVWDEHGYVQIVDRAKDLIISGGENISSVEVEQVLQSHPAVRECAVVPAPHPRWGETPAALVVLKPDMSIAEDELFRYLRERLAHFKVPTRIEIRVESLPKTANGKIQKAELRKRFREEW